MVHTMQQVTVSSRFQVVIPKAVREALGIQPGQRLLVVPHGERIELVPVREISEMKGFLAGMDPRYTGEASECLQAELTDAFAAPDDSYDALSAADLIERNRRLPDA